MRDACTRSRLRGVATRFGPLVEDAAKFGVTAASHFLLVPITNGLVLLAPAPGHDPPPGPGREASLQMAPVRRPASRGLLSGAARLRGTVVP